jgi:hypothetical protein
MIKIIRTLQENGVKINDIKRGKGAVDGTNDKRAKKEPINEHGERRIKTRLGKPINAIG